MVCGTPLATVAEAMPHSVHWEREVGPGKTGLSEEMLRDVFSY